MISRKYGGTDMPLSLSSLLLHYPFKKYDDLSSLAGVYGIFVIVGCTPHDDGTIDCDLLDFGGSVDVKHAIETTLANNNWRETYRENINIMVAAVSLLECETILRDLHKIHKKGS